MLQPLTVVALGGNAIINAKQRGTSEEQFDNVNTTTEHLAQLIGQGFRLVITHGNGPQVGNLLIQHEAGKNTVPALPMDVCGAQSQGQIGYMISQSLRNHLKRLGIKKSVATIVTQVEVDPKDIAFKQPSKPVGPFYDQAWAAQAKENGFDVIEDAGRGYRRVVPSPIPEHIVEVDAIKILVQQGAIVIASGGGGVPVIKKEDKYHGVEAVIDKDYAGELLAYELGAELFVILTDVEKVALNFNKPDQQSLDHMTVSEARQYFDQGHFAKGSMGPKVQACIKFIQHGGKKAIITHPFKVLEAIEGTTGTVIR
jgi:carbamate kinase